MPQPCRQLDLQSCQQNDCMQSFRLPNNRTYAVASITVRNLSAESKERLRQQARLSGCSLESFVRALLDQAARTPVPQSRFPHDLIALVEPGQDIEPFLDELDEPQKTIEL